ncbi:hypothetical protein N7540_003546 [Penicillium herquei]|nr:hypothetical protein N7540_003546 [Penicillium herquei]
MSVTLDNIQFYHGPPNPTKEPNITLSSKHHEREIMSSFPLPTIANRSMYSATDHHGFLPATRSEEPIKQYTAQSLNLFDLEIAKTREMVSSSPTLDGSGECDASLLRPTPNRHHRELSRSPSRDLCKMMEPDCPGRYSEPSSISSSPSLLPMDSVGALLPVSADVIQESASSSTNSGKIFDMCSPYDEGGSSSSFSSILLQPGSTSQAASERSTPPCTFESGPSDSLEPPPVSSSDPSPTNITVSVSGSAGSDNAQYAGVSDLGDVGQAAGCGSSGSYSETTSTQKHVTRRRKQRRETKGPSPGRREDTAGRRHTSVAVVIPPPRRYHLRSLRSSPGHIPSDDSWSESSVDNDNSDDEDFMIDTVTSQVSNAKAHQYSVGESACSITNCSCSTRVKSNSQDIIGQAILTIETLGIEPTYHFTFMPNNPGLMSHVPMRRLCDSDGPAGATKRTTRGSSVRGKRNRQSYSIDEDRLLVELKEQKNLTWKEITRHFPGRKSSSLQVHYSTKLKTQESLTISAQGRKRARRGKCT